MMEGVVAAAARGFGEVPGVKASYAANLTGEPGVTEVPQDITDSPVVVTQYDHFDLVPGTPEIITHYLRCEITVRGRSAAEAERAYLPIVSASVAYFRTHVGLFGQAAPHALIQRGGPPVATTINTQPFIVFPVTLMVKEVSPQNYAL